jgi:hypothetical protein
MDLGLYMRVLWRFRFLVLAGLVISELLAVLTYARIDFDGGLPDVSYRTPLTWASTSTVLVTERGFPWGAASLQDVAAQQRGETPEGPYYTDPNRFTQLALLYVRLAKSDEVRGIIAREGGPRAAAYSVTPVWQDGVSLPVLRFQARNKSPKQARRLAGIATEAFRSYIADRQEANAIPPERRVRLDILRSPTPAVVISKRSKVKPMFVLILGVAVTFGLAFVLENLRPRRRELEVQEPLGQARSLRERTYGSTTRERYVRSPPAARK